MEKNHEKTSPAGKKAGSQGSSEKRDLLDEGVAAGERPAVILYADGACSGNPGPGGWAAILVNPHTGRFLELSGAEPDTTNNRMEMRAVLEGLLHLRSSSSVRVVTDSRYLVEGMKSWVHNWIRNGWRTSDRKPVKNQDLWEELLRLSRTHSLQFEWIAGHAGHKENERCDHLAVAAYRDLVSRGTRPSSGSGGRTPSP
jgi:ribonuclease HI